jgi:hypothetical protein
MPTLVCFALKEEAAPFRKIAAEKLTRISQINTNFLVRENLCQKSVREFLTAVKFHRTR